MNGNLKPLTRLYPSKIFVSWKTKDEDLFLLQNKRRPLPEARLDPEPEKKNAWNSITGQLEAWSLNYK